MRPGARPGSRWALLAVAAALVATTGCASSASVPDRAVGRVLIVAMPGVSWSDVQHGHLPHLATLARRAAIGDVSTRIGTRAASTTDAYLTMGAGSRSRAPSLDGAVALDPGEDYAGLGAADLLERRLGTIPAGIAYLPVGAALDRNRHSSYGAEPGTLGDRLAGAGVHRSVIANADAVEEFASQDPPPAGAFSRGAATTLMGSDGVVPGGTVSRQLLEADPAAPFGTRLDPAEVLHAFDAAWAAPGRSVVLVETSDLTRAKGYGPQATRAQSTALRTAALQASDQLLGDLLARTDPTRDAVLVVSPVSATTTPQLAVALLRAPGVTGGMLRSPTTRRDGYVQLSDVAPTVLRLLHLDAPDQIEGRPFQVGDRSGGDRVARLVHQGTAADFRDGLMPLIIPVIIGLLAVVLAAALLGARVPARGRRALAPAALALLGVVPATFLAGKVAAARSGTATFLAAVAVVAIALGVGGWLVERRRPGLGAVTLVGAIVALFTVDVLLGTPLQLNTVFGYSVAVAGRFTGLGNLAFALYGASVLVLGALLVDRDPDRGLRWALALFGGAILVEGLPMLGADVGGVLSMVPAFGVTALVLAGRRLRWTHVVGLAVAAVATVLVFAGIDELRPEGSQTHLARLAQRAADGHWSTFFDTLGRRLHASFGSADLGTWLLVLVAVAVTAAYVELLGTGAWARVLRVRAVPRHRPLVAASTGLLVLAAVGLVANDSSIAVPTTMLIIVTPVVVLRYLLPPVEGAP